MVLPRVVEERTTASIYRAMIVMACLFACIAAVNYMQTLFDKGDMKRALEVVRDFRGAGGQTVQQALEARHGPARSGEISWEVGIQSSFYGVMRLTATVPLKDDNPQVYRFDVDLVTNGIHPADDHGRELLAHINAVGGSPAGGSPAGGNSGGGAAVPKATGDTTTKPDEERPP